MTNPNDGGSHGFTSTKFMFPEAHVKEGLLRILLAIQAKTGRHTEAHFSELHMHTETILGGAGWWKTEGNDRLWLFTADGLQRAIPSFDLRTVLEVLDAASGITEKNAGKQVKVGGRNMQLYYILPVEDGLWQQHRFAAQAAGRQRLPKLKRIVQSVRNDTEDTGEYASSLEPEPGLIVTAASSLPGWLLTRDNFIGHLMGCHSCHALTYRYYVLGAQLESATIDSGPLLLCYSH